MKTPQPGTAERRVTTAGLKKAARPGTAADRETNPHAMMTEPALLILLALLLLGCVPEPDPEYARGEIPDEAREIFVLNSLAETITVIHPDSVAAGADEAECIYNDVTLTGSSPNHIAYFDGRLWVVNSLDNTLTAYDEDTLEEDGEVHLDRGSNPWQLVMDSAGTTGYIPCYVSGTVLRIDLSTWPDSSDEVPDADEFAAGLALPEGGGMGIDSSGTELLFIACCNNNSSTVGAGSLSVIDTTSGSVTTVDLEPAGFDEGTDRGCNPQAVLVFGDEGEVHVVCTGDHPGSGYDSDDGEIVIVDMDTLTVTGRIAIGGSPNAFPAGIDPTGRRVFLANNGSGITIYNYQTHEIIRGSDDPVLPDGDTSGSYFSGVLYDPETDLLFISDFSLDTVHVLEGSGDFGTVTTLSGSDGPGYLLLVEE